MSLDAYFKITEKDSTIRREIVGGATTFMALSYIIFVQPAVLGAAGMDGSAVMFATCLCSAFACIIMGLWANLPIALAPAMGHNFFFAFTVCGAAAIGGFGLTWQEALAANFIAGLAFLALSALGLRAAIMNAIPTGLKLAIAAGIGLLISFVGLRWAGIMVSHSAAYVELGNLKTPVTLLSLFGLATIAILLAFRVRGAIIVGMIATAAVGYLASLFGADAWGYKLVHGASTTTLNISATAGKVFTGFGPLFSRDVSVVLIVIFTFLILDVFDTIGTLVGVAERGGLMIDGKLPNARRAMMADAFGTLSGTVMGTSTITSYVESSAGVAAGARTGLAAIVTALLLLLSILAYPLVGVFGTAVFIPADQLGSSVVHLVGAFNNIQCYPVIAPVLIIIGCYMLPTIRKIQWDDFSEAIPAFLTILVMQFSLSITDGIAWGFISYTLLKLATGKIKQTPPLVTICSVLFILYYIFARP